MADKKQQIAYGQAGGRGNQGAGLSRFDIGGDPSRYYPVWAAAAMNTNTPAWLLDEGTPSSYGALSLGAYAAPLNLFNDGNVLRPLMAGETDFVAQDIIWTLDGTNYNAITTNNLAYRAIHPEVKVFNVAGEHLWRDNDGTASRLSPVAESFSFAASTITVTNGSNAITVTLANGLTSAATLPGYAYTPAYNAPRAGDVLEVVDGISRFYRIASITGATTGTIFPNYSGPGGAGKTYRIWRTGYGSHSDSVSLIDNSNGDLYHYYAGNSKNVDSAFGTVECVKLSAAGVYTHFMAPVTVDAVGAPTGVSPLAVDVAYYKGFLLYGAGPGISWSVAPFPSSFTTAFGTTDLPAANISAFNRQGSFLYFEHTGEQITAIFDDSVWLVQATGSVPEFTFYKLPEPIGASKPIAFDPQVSVNNVYPRQSCSGRNTVFYNSPYGTLALSGMSTKRISADIEANNGASVEGFPGYGANFSYDPFTDSVILGSTGWTAGTTYLYQPENGSFCRLLTSSSGALADTGGIIGPNFTPYRRFGIGYWRSNRMKVSGIWPEIDRSGAAAAALESWVWPSRIISCGDIYDGFKYGGFRLLARAGSGTSAPVTITWTVYGGPNPSAMAVKETGTYDYSQNASARFLIGAVQDDAYIGILLSGTHWIELAGIAIYDAGNQAGR